MRIKNLTLIILNLILIVLIINFYSIKLIEPLDNCKTINRNPILKWNGSQNNYEVYIDDNKEFTSPIIKEVIGTNYQLNNLDFKRYYWKIKGLFYSKINSFDVVSEVSLKRSREDIINTGNTQLNITVGEKEDSFWDVTGSFILDIGQSFKPKENSGIFAKQNE
jgi:hypothetical protein